MSTWTPERNRRLAAEERRDQRRAQAVAARANPPGTLPRAAHAQRRRHLLAAVSADARLTAMAVRVFTVQILGRSDDQAKPIWGRQERMAAEVGCSLSTLRRCLRELEVLGYLEVYRSTPLRGPDGRWHRRKSNVYYFKLPARAFRALSAPRRRLRAAYCVVTLRHPGLVRLGKSRSDLAVSGGSSTPFGGAEPAVAPRVSDLTPPEEPSDGSPEPSAKERAAIAAPHLAAMHALLGPKRRTRRRR